MFVSFELTADNEVAVLTVIVGHVLSIYNLYT